MSSAQQQSQYDTQRAVDTLQGVELPDVREMQLQLQLLVEQGQISPEEAKAYLLDQSSMNGISLDPRFKNAQLDALSSLQDIANNEGLTSGTRSRLNQIQTEEDQKARGAREAILQNAAQRGISGSGVELLNNLTNVQDSATRASQRGFDTQALAEQQALEALKAGGTLGGQLQTNQFNQQAQIAQANDVRSATNADAINRFNMANVTARNAAQEKNLATKQATANQNVDIQNKQQQYNKTLAQTNFENDLKKNQAIAGALTSKSGQDAAKEASDEASKRQLIGAGIVGVATALSDRSLKKDVEEFNPSEFLDNLTSYKYNYKNPKHGEGKQVGVMAQDLEKAAPQMVEDTPEGKMVDYSKAGGPLFASLADLHDRLKKIEERG